MIRQSRAVLRAARLCASCRDGLRPPPSATTTAALLPPHMFPPGTTVHGRPGTFAPNRNRSAAAGLERPNRPRPAEPCAPQARACMPQVSRTPSLQAPGTTRLRAREPVCRKLPRLRAPRHPEPGEPADERSADVPSRDECDRAPGHIRPKREHKRREVGREPTTRVPPSRACPGPRAPSLYAARFPHPEPPGTRHAATASSRAPRLRVPEPVCRMLRGRARTPSRANPRGRALSGCSLPRRMCPGARAHSSRRGTEAQLQHRVSARSTRGGTRRSARRLTRRRTGCR
ncbi:MAG: hypothetical protein JWQ12_2055 [Glaciihabitans sp.]|nr:hypothetical protein [Glaciihabitans sp.]